MEKKIRTVTYQVGLDLAAQPIYVTHYIDDEEEIQAMKEDNKNRFRHNQKKW